MICIVAISVYVIGAIVTGAILYGSSSVQTGPEDERIPLAVFSGLFWPVLAFAFICDFHGREMVMALALGLYLFIGGFFSRAFHKTALSLELAFSQNEKAARNRMLVRLAMVPIVILLWPVAVLYVLCLGSRSEL